MGYNTLFFGLNDFADEYQRSPKTFAWILSNAHLLSRDGGNSHGMAQYLGEHSISPQALRAVDCFHANETNYYQAGGNIVKKLPILRKGKTKDGKRTVTLLLD